MGKGFNVWSALYARQHEIYIIYIYNIIMYICFREKKTACQEVK